MKNSSRGLRTAVVVVLGMGLVLGVGAVAAAKSMRGQLYMFTKSTTLSSRVGTPCVQDKAAQEQSFCDRTYQCPDGQVARGLIYNVNVENGQGTLSGVGLMCVDPNEVYLTDEVGAYGTDFGGEIFRDTCDTGYFLTGTLSYTSDRRNVTGARRHCRRYWPVAEQQGANVFGSGDMEEFSGCPDGRFVTGLKVSYFQNTKPDGVTETVLRNYRFYCSEMRHWIGEPDDVRDPRDPKTRK